MWNLCATRGLDNTQELSERLGGWTDSLDRVAYRVGEQAGNHETNTKWLTYHSTNIELCLSSDSSATIPHKG